MSNAKMGDCELVYCTIKEIGPMVAGTRTIQFKHLSGKTAPHAWSSDKNYHQNCYADLEEGNNYLIVTKLEYKTKSVNRWVWKCFWLMTKKELGIVQQLCGVAPTVEQLEEALEVIQEYRNRNKPRTLEDAKSTLVF